MDNNDEWLEPPLECSECSKEKNIYYTRIVDNEILRYKVCKDCHVLKKHFFENVEEGTFKCSSCNNAIADVGDNLKLGCQDCYYNFSKIVKTSLGDFFLQRLYDYQDSHIDIESITFSESVKEILDEAISQEDFSKASWIKYYVSSRNMDN